jgi:hypothetical protein
MEDCKRDKNERRSTDRRIESKAVSNDRRHGGRRSGTDRRDILDS